MPRETAAQARRAVLDFVARGLDEDTEHVGIVGDGWNFDITAERRRQMRKLARELRGQAKERGCSP